MDSNTRIICIRKLAKFLIVSYILLVIFLKIFGLTLKEWVHQGKDLKEWKGDLFSVYKSGALIKEKSYLSLKTKYCDSYYNYPNITSDFNMTYSDGAVLCRRFSFLNSGFIAFIIFSVFSILFSTFFLLIGLKIENPKGYVCFFRFLSVFYVINETIGMICIGAASNFTLYDDCHYLSWNQDHLIDTKTCPGPAVVFSFFVSLGIVITNLLFTILSCCYWMTFFKKYFTVEILEREERDIPANSINIGEVGMEKIKEVSNPNENIIIPPVELKKQNSIENVD